MLKLFHLLDFLSSPATTLANLATGFQCRYDVPVKIGFLVSVGSHNWFPLCWTTGNVLALQLGEPVDNHGTTTGILFSVGHERPQTYGHGRLWPNRLWPAFLATEFGQTEPALVF